MTTPSSNTQSNAQGSFGAMLQQARKTKQVSLEDAAAELFILKRHLQALENENFADLPQAAFARGFAINLSGKGSRMPKLASVSAPPWRSHSGEGRSRKSSSICSWLPRSTTACAPRPRTPSSTARLPIPRSIRSPTNTGKASGQVSPRRAKILVNAALQPCTSPIMANARPG